MTQATDGVRFFVPGIAKPAGSKVPFVITRGAKAAARRAAGLPPIVIQTDDSDRPGADGVRNKGKAWRQDVKSVAFAAMEGAPPFGGPLRLAVTFILTRPKGHHGTGRNCATIKDSAPAYPQTKPDATKLLRGLEDACTGIVWGDDAQIVDQHVCKVYGDHPGARVEVERMEPPGCMSPMTGRLLETTP